MRLTATALLLVTVLVLLSGCSEYWYQEGKSFEECQRDLEASQAEAFRYSNGGTNRYESEFVRASMEKKGYELLKKKELPVGTRRENSPVLGVPGAAGAFE